MSNPTPIVIADDLSTARAAWKALPAGSGVTVITKSGDVLSRYVLRGGSGAKRSRLELVADRDAANERLGEVTSLIERARFALAEHRGALELAKEQSAHALVGIWHTPATHVTPMPATTLGSASQLRSQLPQWFLSVIRSNSPASPHVVVPESRPVGRQSGSVHLDTASSRLGTASSRSTNRMMALSVAPPRPPASAPSSSPPSSPRRVDRTPTRSDARAPQTSWENRSAP